MGFDYIRTAYKGVDPSDINLQVSRDLERAHRLTFSRKDLSLVEERIALSGIGNVEELYAKAQQAKRASYDSQSVTKLQDAVINAHIEDFLGGLQNRIEDVYKPVVNTIIKRLLRERRYHEISQYLGQIETHGFKAAMAAFHNPYAGGKLGHIWVGFACFVEFALFLTVTFYCQPGFERLIIASLAFAYTILRVHSMRSNSGDVARFNALKSDIEAVRVTLDDTTFCWEERNEEYDKQIRSNHRDTIQFFIVMIKLWFMQAIAAEEIIRTVL